MADDTKGNDSPILTGAELDERVSVNVFGRDDILKSFLGGKQGEQVQESNAIQANDEMERKFSGAGALEPPYNFATLTSLLEHSNSLRPNVDAYAMNIDGFGHRFEPVIDLDAPDADDRIARVIQQERELAASDPAQPASVMGQSTIPTPDEVAAKKAELTDVMRAEKARLENFFNFCCDEMSFVGLRRRMRQDLETIGNAFVEVLRNGAGEIAEFTYIPAFTMRLMPQDLEPVAMSQNVKATELSYVKQERHKRFRKLVQAFETRTVFFKEFGDPRIMSRSNGAIFATLAELFTANAKDGPATEVIHLKVHSPRSVYGVPRWIGTLLAVLGSRQAEEVNYLYFENKSIPPLAILVSGGKLGAQAVTRLESYLTNEIKGKRNFHKVLVIEAEGSQGASLTSGGGSAKIELKPLTDAQTKDGLFQNYDERNMDKVGIAFRLPRLLRGDIRDFNRATADAALEFAEQQVFGPEREDFDFLINRRVFADLGVRFWRFVSNAPKTNDPAQLATIIVQLVTASVITPAEARQLAEKVFGKELKNLKAGWTKQPIALTLAGMMAEPEPDDPNGVGEVDGAGSPTAPAKSVRGDAPLVTRSALSQIVTVNEARVAAGYGPLMQPDGTPHPGGHLSLAAFQAERMASMKATTAPRPLRAIGTDPADALLALRDALLAAEEREAAADFHKAKRRDHARGESAVSAEAMRILLEDDDVAELLKGDDAVGA